MARWILSFGIEAALALFTARRRRGLKFTSAMPVLAATVISFASLENSLALALSALPLRCWMLAHLLWPAMENSRSNVCWSPWGADGSHSRQGPLDASFPAQWWDFRG